MAWKLWPAALPPGGIGRWFCASPATLWYSRIRDRIWSWAYREWTERGEQSGWAMSIVFDWIADQADVLGDLPAAAINRENARVARIAA
jgi:hypothetical protein